MCLTRPKIGEAQKRNSVAPKIGLVLEAERRALEFTFGHDKKLWKEKISCAKNFLDILIIPFYIIIFLIQWMKILHLPGCESFLHTCQANDHLRFLSVVMNLNVSIILQQELCENSLRRSSSIEHNHCQSMSPHITTNYYDLFD